MAVIVDSYSESNRNIYSTLKALKPDTYREKSVIDKAIIGDIIIKMAIPPYNESMRLETPKIEVVEGESRVVSQ